MPTKKAKITTPAQAKRQAKAIAEPAPAIGRPPIPEEERAVVFSLRLTPARIEKFKQLGGAKWLSPRIDKAKLPE